MDKLLHVHVVLHRTTEAVTIHCCMCQAAPGYWNKALSKICRVFALIDNTFRRDEIDNKRIP